MTNYEDPENVEKWCSDRRNEVTEYLKNARIAHSCIGEQPAWHLAPYVSIWAIESATHPGWVGWWVICGDLPTDYLSANTIRNPQDAMRAFSERWMEISGYMMRGEEHPNIHIGTYDTRQQLGPLLQARAEVLAQWANDNNNWESKLQDQPDPTR